MLLQGQESVDLYCASNCLYVVIVGDNTLMVIVYSLIEVNSIKIEIETDSKTI